MIAQHTSPERAPHEVQLYHPGHGPGHGGRPTTLLNHVGVALIFILILYAILLWMGYPQQWTQELNDSFKKTENYVSEKAEHDAEYGTEPDQTAEKKPRPPIIMVIPFGTLLICVAILPLIPATAHWWENNMNKFWVGSTLGIATLLYYYFACDFPVNQYWPGKTTVDPAGVGGFGVAKAVFINAIIYEFLPFIVLLFSLFTITGGIRICSSWKATPFVNSAIIFIGAFLASFIGTTGAAMLLIRPLLDMNRHREHKAHTIVFFIFCVCNCGGCLTPLGDPPLFLGYLRGVPFEWTIALIPMWVFVNTSLVAVYFLWDSLWSYPKESLCERRERNEVEQPDQPDEQSGDSATLHSRLSFTISGWKLNVPLLLGVIAAIAFLDPGRTVPGTDWNPWFFLREAVQLALATASLFWGNRQIRKENVFNFFAIGEVAALFFGIFLCMQPPLQILNQEGRHVVYYARAKTGLNKEMLFFWTTGSLGSMLDNAPTYVVFFEKAKALSPKTEAEHEQWKKDTGREFMPVPIRGGYIDHKLLIAVSLGAVFMGALTYIGNAPNFLIKAVAEQDGVRMPSFFGFMVYSFLIILPLMIAMAFLFLYVPPAAL